MKNIYFANIWPQIITERGIQLFKQSGFSISGNWLDESRDLYSAHKIIFPYANFGDAIIIPESDLKIRKKTISYILFPDACVGWDYKNNHYLNQKSKILTESFKLSPKILSHSVFSLEVLRKVYGSIDATVVPLGVDIKSIRSFPRGKHQRLNLLWNHMWRSDKGTLEAFGIISQLAKKYPHVEFLIGQSGTWGERSNSIQYKELCQPIIGRLRSQPNVRFLERFRSQSDYWRLLRQVDIGFSTSFHEGFGLSIMEQEAAGMACVVPNNEVYPELHTGCLIVDRAKIIEGLECLIENSQIRGEVGFACEENSFKYDISAWVKHIIANL